MASAVPRVKVGDCQYNLKEIEQMIARAEGQGVEVIVFPELCLTGYTCQDLFRQQLLLDAAEQSVLMLLDFTRQLDIITIVGAPITVGTILMNCAIVIQKGAILSIIPKTYSSAKKECEIILAKHQAQMEEVATMSVRFYKRSL